MVDGNTVRDALTWLHGLMAHDEAQEIEDADAFVALTLETEFGSIHVQGPFPDPVSALAWAERHEEELNRGNHDDPHPYVVIVRPMTTPQE